MVLAELGTKLSNALKKFENLPFINEEVFKELLQEIARALLQADVNVRLVQKFRENILFEFKMLEDQGENLRELMRALVAKELTKMLDCERKPFQPKKGKSNIILFVGIQGSGKTTNCVKYAHYWQKKGWKTALVFADPFKAGAFDSMGRISSTKIRVPFYGSFIETDLVQIAEDGISLFKKEGHEVK